MSPAPRHRPAARLLVRVLAIVLTVVAVAVPAAVAADRLTADPTVSDQESPPAPRFTREDLAAFREHAADAPSAQPIVLSYHDVRPEPGPNDPYTLTPQQFADQMGMLHAAGFDVISGEELLAWTRGELELPPHPVVLTFDDGTHGLWTWADPIMERYGYEGIVFAITQLVGTHRPYYLSWSELELMVESGRWEVQSHTADGHHRIPTSGDGEVGPFLTQQKWLEEQGRLETVEEFSQRIGDDLQTSIEDLTAHGFPAPTMFAYPFSAAEPIPFDAELEQVVHDHLARRFDTTLINSEQPGPLTQRDVEQGELRRLEVFNSTTARQLFDQLVDVKPIPVEGTLTPLTDPSRWLDNSFKPAGDEVTEGVWRPDDGTWTRIAYAPGQTADWTAYQASATVSGLGGAGADRYAGLTALSGTDREVHVNVSGDYLTVQHGPLGERVAGERITPADAHDVAIAISPKGVAVVVDGRIVAVLPPTEEGQTGGVALAAGRSEGEPWPVVTDLVVRPFHERGGGGA